MSSQSVKLKLSAIFSADVKGYSRLMDENEVTTVRTLEEYQETLATIIQQHRGRVEEGGG